MQHELRTAMLTKSYAGAQPIGRALIDERKGAITVRQEGGLRILSSIPWLWPNAVM